MLEERIDNKERLKEVGKLFFKLGCIAFGGPAAHIAMMEEEVISKRKWMDRQHFLDLMGATNLIPGPNSTEMVMHCGHERAGWKGMVVAGLAFIFPAVMITAVFAWLYQQYGQLPAVAPFIYGIKPAVIAIILSAMLKLGQKALKHTQLWVLAGLTVLACVLGVNEIAAMFSCGVIGVFLYYIQSSGSASPKSFVPLLAVQAAYALQESMTLKVFWHFLKIGSLLYGSGYVLFAFLDAELVANGWLTRQELMDAVAVGQFTPGPVLSTATFVGWQMGGGPAGALAATVGIFAPSFILVAILNPLMGKVRKSKPISAFLDAVNAAAVAVIAAVMIEMGQETLTDWRTIAIALISIAVTQYWKSLNSAYVVVGGALIGYVLHLI
ncbi:chromate efflux transporter [Limibacter armeniacum]|uniref:chromate efflux transporter n=1 Tax=Limibacter armeniacum TaxID=466084 RepID=UPI002FE60820